MSDLISRQAAIEALGERPMVWVGSDYELGARNQYDSDVLKLETVPSAQPEHLRDDDFEAIRIHLNAYKERLCNQHRWEEAEEYQRIIDRFMSFASAQPEKRTNERTETHDKRTETRVCDCISRKAAIDAIKEDKIDLTNPNVRAVFKSTGDFEKVETQVMTCDRHIKILKDLPPAQPERILARWEKQVLGWKCSNCTLCTGDFGAREFSFCPNCGAKMEGLEVNE